MRVATCKQCQEIDTISQDEYLLSGEILMESAGSHAAREIDQNFLPELTRGTLGIVCGPGNNGGDGLVVARHLHSSGHRDIQVFLVGGESQKSELYSLQLTRLQKQGIRCVDLSSDAGAMEHLMSCTLLVDAIFGIGLSRPVEGKFAKVIEALNAARCAKVALDIPSGLDGDKGLALGVAVKSEMTISFGLAKPGFFISEGPSFVGRLRVVPIGFPYEALRKVATTHFAFGEKLARRYMPKRSDQSNKSDYGHLMVFAGQKGMWGASVLAATSAFRIGAGYVTLCASEDPSSVVNLQPEIMTKTWGDKNLFAKKVTAYALGPGLGVNELTRDMIIKLKELNAERVVIDADGITTCVEYDLFPLPESWVITPHAGELSRIISISATEIESDRIGFALSAAKKVGCHVLLKGFRSVLAYEDRCMIVVSGNSALAKAGSGDVLTGMIGGILAQGLPTVQGTATATYIHGRLADEWIRVGHSKSSLLPSDLSQQLPSIMGRIEGGVL